MAISPSEEKLITFKQAAEHFKELTHINCDVESLYHYAGIGKPGMRLDSVKIGESLFTTKEAVQHFAKEAVQHIIQAVTAAMEGETKASHRVTTENSAHAKTLDKRVYWRNRQRLGAT